MSHILALNQPSLGQFFITPDEDLLVSRNALLMNILFQTGDIWIGVKGNVTDIFVMKTLSMGISCTGHFILIPYLQMLDHGTWSLPNIHLKSQRTIVGTSL